MKSSGCPLVLDGMFSQGASSEASDRCSLDGENIWYITIYKIFILRYLSDHVWMSNTVIYDSLICSGVLLSSIIYYIYLYVRITIYMVWCDPKHHPRQWRRILLRVPAANGIVPWCRWCLIPIVRIFVSCNQLDLRYGPKVWYPWCPLIILKKFGLDFFENMWNADGNCSEVWWEGGCQGRNYIRTNAQKTQVLELCIYYVICRDVVRPSFWDRSVLLRLK